MFMKKKILTLLMSGCYGILAAQTTGTVVDEIKADCEDSRGPAKAA